MPLFNRVSYFGLIILVRKEKKSPIVVSKVGSGMWVYEILTRRKAGGIRVVLT